MTESPEQGKSHRKSPDLFSHRQQMPEPQHHAPHTACEDKVGKGTRDTVVPRAMSETEELQGHGSTAPTSWCGMRHPGVDALPRPAHSNSHSPRMTLRAPHREAEGSWFHSCWHRGYSWSLKQELS